VKAKYEKIVQEVKTIKVKLCKKTDFLKGKKIATVDKQE